MSIIDQFQQDPDVYIFLVSTMAGGTGLNLTGTAKAPSCGETLLILLRFSRK